MAKPYSGQIPFDVDGNFQRYPGGSYGSSPPVWRDNEVFETVLTFEGFERGRSAAYVRLTESNGRTVYMFLMHLEECLLTQGRGFMNGNQLGGWWTYAKRGQNYGIAPADPADEEIS